MKGLETPSALGETIARTIGQKDSILFRKVVASRIPRGVKALIQEELSESLLGELESSRTLERVFRRETVGGRMILTFSKALAQEYRFDRKEFVAAAERAVDFLAQYLVRPRVMMEQWVFGLQDVVPADRVERKLSALSEYRYLSVLLIRTMRKNGLREVELPWFRKKIATLDDLVIADHSPRELIRITKPIFEFALFGSPPERAVVAVSLLRDFFLEKKRPEFWKSVERSLEADQSAIGFHDFARLLAKEKKEPNTVDLPPAVSHDEIPRPVQEDEEHFPGEPMNIGTAEPQQEREQGSPRELPPLSEVITKDQERAFVTRLFRKDNAYYRAVMASLDALQTWREAALFLSEFYQTNNLDPFADDVVEFTDAIHGRYEDVVAR